MSPGPLLQPGGQPQPRGMSPCSALSEASAASSLRPSTLILVLRLCSASSGVLLALPAGPPGSPVLHPQACPASQPSTAPLFLSRVAPWHTQHRPGTRAATMLGTLVLRVVAGKLHIPLLLTRSCSTARVRRSHRQKPGALQHPDTSSPSASLPAPSGPSAANHSARCWPPAVRLPTAQPRSTAEGIPSLPSRCRR